MLVFALSGSLRAQAPTGTIAGTVTDQSGAVLPGATVTVTNKDTGASRVVQSGSDGAFSIPDVPAGTYTVKAWHPDFGYQERSVSVPASGSASVNFAF